LGKKVISIMTKDLESCAICGSPYHLEPHHCLHGSYRHLAHKDHLIVMLCHRCHRNLHDHGWFDSDLQEEAEMCWIKQHKATEEDFIKRYTKSWLDSGKSTTDDSVSR